MMVGSIAYKYKKNVASLHSFYILLSGNLMLILNQELIDGAICDPIYRVMIGYILTFHH